MFNEKSLLDIKGKKLYSITGMNIDSDEIIFKCQDGSQYRMYHRQDCCEVVELIDVCGDVNDLLDSKIVEFGERTTEGDTNWGSETHTFYHITTQKGTVVLRWHGQSNGYYSEQVNFEKVN